MTVRALSVLVVFWATSSLGQSVIDGPPPTPREKSRVFTSEAVRAKGFSLLKVVDADLDGDGRKENVGAAQGKDGLVLVLIGENKAGAVVTQVLPPAGGGELVRFESLPLSPPAASREIVLEVGDETPDEKVRRLRVYGWRDGALIELMTTAQRRPRGVDEREDFEKDPALVQYGDARTGWSFEDIDGDGSVEVLVRRKPQILQLGRDDGAAVKLLTGVREEVWRYDDAKRLYAQAGDRLRDFLPAYPVVATTASSTFIEPDELRRLQNDALQRALSMPTKSPEQSLGGELELGLEELSAPASTTKAAKEEPGRDRGLSSKGSPALASPGGKSKRAPTEPSVPPIEIDRSTYIARIADKNLSTAWVEGNEKGPGEGEWVELELAAASPIHMVRVVGGCVDTKESFRAFNVPESFTVRLGDGAEAVVNRREPEHFSAPLVAFADHLVKLKDRPWAKTTLVFFDGRTTAKKVRVTLGKAIVQGKGNHTCISEVSVH
jgi:hypothetical protein